MQQMAAHAVIIIAIKARSTQGVVNHVQCQVLHGWQVLIAGFHLWITPFNDNVFTCPNIENNHSHGSVDIVRRIIVGKVQDSGSCGTVGCRLDRPVCYTPDRRCSMISVLMMLEENRIGSIKFLIKRFYLTVVLDIMQDIDPLEVGGVGVLTSEHIRVHHFVRVHGGIDHFLHHDHIAFIWIHSLGLKQSSLKTQLAFFVCPESIFRDQLDIIISMMFRRFVPGANHH
jgi:hypothetical protein